MCGERAAGTGAGCEGGGVTYSLHGVVQVTNVHQLALQQAVVNPAQLLGALLVNQEPGPQFLRSHIQETSELLQVHSRVEAQVRLDSRVPHVGLHLIHEDRQVVVDGVHVGLGVIEVRGDRRDELGAGSPEKLLEDGERLGATALQLEQLITVLLPQGSVNGVVQAGRVEGDADGDEGIHLVVLLGDGVVLGVLLEVLGARHVDQDVAEHANGIGVSVLHHVGEADVVVGGEVSGHDAGKHGLLVELDIIESLQGEAEVTKQAVDSEEANDGEITQHPVEGLIAVFSSDGIGVLVSLHGGKLFGNLGTLDEGVEDVEDAVATPGVGVFA